MDINELGWLWILVWDSNQILESGCILQDKFEMASSLVTGTFKFHVRSNTSRCFSRISLVESGISETLPILRLEDRGDHYITKPEKYTEVLKRNVMFEVIALHHKVRPCSDMSRRSHVLIGRSESRTRNFVQWPRVSFSEPSTNLPSIHSITPYTTRLLIQYFCLMSVQLQVAVRMIQFRFQLEFHPTSLSAWSQIIIRSTLMKDSKNDSLVNIDIRVRILLRYLGYVDDSWTSFRILSWNSFRTNVSTAWR
jgi:hypothetical protein